MASAAAALVFGLWYPYPYREISGGRDLFFLVVAVDVVMGPLLTFAVFSNCKPKWELRRDLTIIGLLQLSALVYGLWAASVARPVYLVFEFDRFRVVHAVEIPDGELESAAPEFRRLPWTGPTLLALRPFRSERESLDATLGALGGVPLGARPSLWQSYSKAKGEISQAAKPISELKKRFPAQSSQVDSALKSVTAGPASRHTMAYLPLAGRDKFWTVLLDINTTEVIAFVPIDSF